MTEQEKLEEIILMQGKETIELQERIKKALIEIDELQQAIFGLEDKMWIYGALENIVKKLKENEIEYE